MESDNSTTPASGLDVGYAWFFITKQSLVHQSEALAAAHLHRAPRRRRAAGLSQAFGCAFVYKHYQAGRRAPRLSAASRPWPRKGTQRTPPRVLALEVIGCLLIEGLLTEHNPTERGRLCGPAAPFF
jgi:hypothetical protein